MVNGTPYLMGATTPEERDLAFSVNMALSPLAGFTGSLVAGLLPGLLANIPGLSLDGPAPYGYPLFIAPVLYTIAAFALLRTSEVSADRARGAADRTGPVPHGLIALIALFSLLEASAEWGARVFLNVYLDTALSTPSSLIGAVPAVSQLVSVPAALVAPVLVRRLGRGRTVTLGTPGVACGLLPLALIPQWAAGGLGFVAARTMASIMFPVFAVYYQEVVPLRWRTVASGAVSMAFGLRSAGMAFGGGYIIGATGYRSVFLLGAVLAALAALVFWAALRPLRFWTAEPATA
jgi:predicted MFS family arabinose efflux permease